MCTSRQTNDKGSGGECNWRLVLLSLLLVAAATAAYSNSFHGVFLFDDVYHVVENERIIQWWPPWELLEVERPVVELSLAFNYALGGLIPWGYHAFNLLVHILATLILFGVVRRTFVTCQSRERKPADAPLVTGLAPGALLAFVVALLWAVHPLQTQSVTYVIQRGESLMGLFYLLTIYCAIRGLHSSRQLGWHVASVVACALGMASKAVMVTAPVMVVLYDFVFGRRGFSNDNGPYDLSTNRESNSTAAQVGSRTPRWRLYLALAATWSILWACGVAAEVFDPVAQQSHVGFGYHGLTPLQYAATQPGVNLNYLRLAFWPVGLCLDYDWSVASSLDVIIPPTMVILGLLVATTFGLLRRSWPGFAGAWFFVILAPTSSFVPIKDLAFEHRMYLPLAAVIAVSLIGGQSLLIGLLRPLAFGGKIGGVIQALVVVVVATLLAFGTYRRNDVYRSDLAMWADVAAKRPYNARARVALGNALLARNRIDEAISAYREAVAIQPDFADGYCALGMGLARKGALEDSVAAYHESLRLNPNFAKAHYNLGNALNRLGKVAESIQSFRASLLIQPRFADAHCNLANALVTQGQLEEAVAEYREALRLKPGLANAHKGLGDALIQLGRVDEGIAELREAIRLQPDYANAHASLALALFDHSEYAEALRHAQEALLLDPNHPTANEILNRESERSKAQRRNGG